MRDEAAVVRSIICQGCENECEVSIAFRDGVAVCLGGNNCPTGESYALAQACDGFIKGIENKGKDKP